MKKISIETIMAVPVAATLIIGKALAEVIFDCANAVSNLSDDCISNSNDTTNELENKWEQELEYKYDDEIQEMLERCHLSHIWNVEHDGLQKCKEAIIRDRVINNHKPW